MSDQDPERALRRLVLLNGTLVPLPRAAISPLDRGFLYGDGLFETMRAEEGAVLYLEEHLRRLRSGLEALRISTGGAVMDAAHWKPLLGELLEGNGLHRGSASVKIVVSRGVRPGLGLPPSLEPTVFASAESYDPPAPSRYRDGWRLHVVAGGNPSSLVRFKTLNYLFFLMARQEALDGGFDEALILDAAGSVAETAAGSLLLRTEAGWIRPETPFQLAGITVGIVARMLESEGVEVSVRPVSGADLAASRTVWVLNSLIGIMPASAVDGRLVPEPEAGHAERLRKKLFRI